MPLPSLLQGLRLPIIQAPMFLVSGVELVTANCKAGIVGTLPALNAWTDEILDSWLTDIQTRLDQAKKEKSKYPVAPYGVNLIVHKTNPRLETNLEQIVKHKVPIVITSLGAAKDVIDAVHDYGGLVFHDVTNVVHAKKAANAGVDGLILVSSGAGGHAGATSPFALVPAIRSFYDKTVIVGGAISTGGGVLAAQALGADLAYMGTRFIPTAESMAENDFKEMITKEGVGPAPSFLPTIYTDKVSGIHANFLRASLVRAGLNPDKIEGEGLGTEEGLYEGENVKKSAWKDIWSAGHGVITIDDIKPSAQVVDQLEQQYVQAKRALSAGNSKL